ncbi:hypothetical protein SUGI_0339080 [Cryptomeria japonica]|nr:hypothetical protein SUGI_0339080 [Cryptomeria japonica]
MLLDINGGLGGKRLNSEEICIDFTDELEEDMFFWEKHATVIKFIPKGFFVVLFEDGEDRNQILNQENWFANNHAIYLQPWSSNFDPIPLVVYFAPVWIRLYNLPIEYWSEDLLEKIGRTLGTLLEVDFDDEDDLCKYARLRIAVVKRIPEPVTFLISSDEWPQQVEIEKEIKQCPRCERRENDAVSNTLRFTPSCKGISDTEFEFEKVLDDDLFGEDELENIDPRYISQLANALLGKAKRFRGRRSSHQKREERAREKCIISVLDFMKKAKGEGISLGKR